MVWRTGRWLDENSYNQRVLATEKTNSEFEQYVSKVNFNDPDQVNDLALLVKKNLDVIGDLAKTYKNSLVKLSLKKITHEFVPDTNFLYSRDIAGLLPSWMRYHNSDIENLQSFFYLLVLRINELGRCKLNDEDGSFARYFVIHQNEIYLGLGKLTHTYLTENKYKKQKEIQVINTCRLLLEPLGQAFDQLFDPKKEQVNKAATYPWMLRSVNHIADFLELEQFAEIRHYLQNMPSQIHFPSKESFILICLRAGIENASSEIKNLNRIIEEKKIPLYKVERSKQELVQIGIEINKAIQESCIKLLENDAFKDIHLELCLALFDLDRLIGYSKPQTPKLNYYEVQDPEIKKIVMQYVQHNLSSLKKNEKDEKTLKAKLIQYWRLVKEKLGSFLCHMDPYKKIICFLDKPFDVNADPNNPGLPFTCIGCGDVERFISNVWLKFDDLNAIDLMKSEHRLALLNSAENVILEGFKEKTLKEDALQNWITLFPELLELGSLKKLKMEVEKKSFETPQDRIAYICQELKGNLENYL